MYSSSVMHRKKPETDIDISDFSLKEKNMLQNGVYYENAEELFKYLESNTS